MRQPDFQESIFDQFERVARAFASSPRLRIIDLLAQSERSVEAVAAQTGLSVANTSRHLQVLRQAGIVIRRRDRQQLIYRMADPAVFRGYQALREVAESTLAEVGQLAEAFFTKVDGAEPVTFPDLRALMEQDRVTVVDVRPTEEYAAGHLAGAINIPLPELEHRMGVLPESVPVVAYCRGPYCVLAATAVDALRRAGRSAHRLEAGLPEWQGAGLPVVRGTDPSTSNPTATLPSEGIPA